MTRIVDWKLASGFLMLLTLFGANAWLANTNLSTVAESREWVSHTHQVVGEVNASLSALMDAETGLRGYLLTGNESYTEPYRAGIRAAERHLDSVRTLTRDNPNQQVRVMEFDRTLHEKIGEMDAVIRINRTEGSNAALARFLNGGGVKLLDRMRVLSESMTRAEMPLLADREARSAASERDARIALGLSFVLGMLLLGGFFYVINRATGERETAAQEIAERELRKSAILEAAMDAVVTIDSRGSIIEWNPVAASLFGYSRDEAIGKEMASLIIPPEFREQHRSGLARYLETGQSNLLNRRVELMGVGADGAGIPIELAITPIRHLRREVLFTGFMRDLREKRRNEREREQLSHYNEMLLETSAEGIYGLDMEGRCTFINRTGARLLGFDREELIGRNMHALTHHHRPDGSEYPVEECPIYRSFQRQTLQRGDDEHFWRKDGTLIPIEFSAAPMVENDRPIGAVVTFSDISARKEAQEELLAAKEAAETANRTKSQFLANMSHELRTPLNAIIGYSEMLAEEAEDEEAGSTRDLLKIHKAGRHLLALINDILDLSKIEAGKMELFIEPFDLNAMIDDVVTTIYPLLDKNGNRLELRCAQGMGAMVSDLTKVRQNLFNMLSNAAKFTSNGTVTLSVDLEERSGIKGVRFMVADTGVGMTPEQIGHIFEPFSQADASTTRKYGGTGLGLAITRRFCLMMGGDISVDSALNRGSNFTMWLPIDGLVREAAEPGGAAHQISESSEAPIVLIIDDDAEARDLLERTLTREGFRVATAQSGEIGLKLARELRPSVITLDVLMPRMDGWSVLKSIKSDAELSTIPVIMLTMTDNKSLGLRLGASEYMTKPVDRGRLVAVLERYSCMEPPCTVLVVEDDDTTRELMREILAREKWIVLEASNGRMALDVIAKSVPSLILLDLMMPGMDGFELTAALQAQPEWASIPIIVLTAKDMTEEDVQRLNGWVEKVLIKGGQSNAEIAQAARDLVNACGSRDPSSAGKAAR